jgi:hypothetical protein
MRHAHPRPRDVAFAEMITWLKQNRMEAHTDLRGSTVFKKKEKRVRKSEPDRLVRK